MLNVVCLEGNLTRDPEFKKLSEQSCVCEMAVAVNKYLGTNPDGSKKEVVSYIDIKAWGKLGEACIKNLEKGRRITVQGELQQQRWQQDGANRSRIYVVASSISFQGRREREERRDEEQHGEQEPAV